MKKVISSAFILLLLLVALWVASSWFLGGKTEQKLKVFFENEQLSSDSIFSFQLLKYDRSFMGSKIKVQAQLNPNNTLAQFIQNSFSSDLSQDVEVAIVNGPIFFGKTGMHFGSSIWKPVFESESTTASASGSLNLFDFIKALKTRFVVDFEDKVDYQVALESSYGEMLVTGSYKLSTTEHKGKLSSQQVLNIGEKQQINIAPFELNYERISSDDNDKNQFRISTEVQEVEYKNNLLDEKLKFQLSFKGDISLADDVLDSEGIFNFESLKNNNESKYPVDTGRLVINVNEMPLNKLLSLSSSLADFRGLQQQSQWILEEQGEYPEGQDQIWLAQDSASQYLRQLPKLIDEVLIKDKNVTNQGDMKDFDIEASRIKFSLRSLYKNKKSTVDGAFFPVDIDVNEDVSQLTLRSLIQAQSKVNLDEELLGIISTRLPIKKSNFNLIYKQNKLLMQ